MTAFRVLPAGERKVERWRNGGGVTEPIAIFPADAGPDDFLWRASIAKIDTAGAFSHFPGIDRWFAVVDGKLSLTIEDQQHEIDPDGAIMIFPGEAAVTAKPLNGPTSDFNLMVRRGAATAFVDRRSGVWDIRSETALLLAPTAMHVDVGYDAIVLQARDALLCNGAGGHRVIISDEAIVAEISMIAA
jgi:environmental stress-induced protein Ves